MLRPASEPAGDVGRAPPRYKGPAGIAEYRAIPHEDVGGRWFHDVDRTLNLNNPVLAARPARSQIYVETKRREEWRVYAGTDRHSVNATWKVQYDFYPCSMMKRAESLAFPDSTARAFSDSGKVDGTKEMICDRIMRGCTGDHAQFDSHEACVAFYATLPHHDATCNAKYGSEFTGMGYSFHCKYLHHFMIDFSPELHCYHSGPGDRGPDAAGKHKCAPDDCADDLDDGAAYCAEGEAAELAAGTVEALLFCAPALAGAPVGANCTQAVNTFLGRFAASGALCACERTGVSALLDALDVDALVLVDVARSGPYALAFDLPACVDDSRDRAPCDGPEEIMTRRGCGLWDWRKLDTTMRGEWSGARQGRFRVTRDNGVAGAECAAVASWLSWRAAPPDEAVFLGGKGPSPNHRGFVDFLALIDDGDAVQIFPMPLDGGDDAPVVELGHAKVTEFVAADQERTTTSRLFDLCRAGGFDAARKLLRRADPVTKDTGSAAHGDERALWHAFFGDVLRGSARDAAAPPVYVAEDPGYDRDRADGDLTRAVWLDLFRRLFRVDARAWAAWGETARDAAANLELSQMMLFFMPETWHRARGYAAAAAVKSSKRLAGGALMELRGAEFRAALAATVGADAPADHHVLLDLAAPVNGAQAIVRDLVEFIRTNPCALLPLWEADKTAFIVEFERVFGPVVSFARAHGGAFKFYSRSSAARDPAVFPRPDRFDPARDHSDLDIFNAREGDAGDPAAPSMKRVCPGRAFALRAMRENVDAHLPTGVSCAHGNRKVHGVCFETTLARARGGRVLSVDVARPGCARPPGAAADRALFLYLGSPEDPPSTFATLVTHVDKGHGAFYARASDHWVLRYPGVGAGATRAASCAIGDDAAAVKGLLKELRRGGRRAVYVVGHGYGARVAWHVAAASSRRLLAGAVVFEAHPAAVHGAAARKPIGPWERALLSPVIGGAYAAAGDYALWRNRTVADDHETRLHLQRVGAHGLRCRLAENYAYHGGRLVPRDATAHHLDPSVDILMVDALRDGIYEGVNTRGEFLASYALVHLQKGQLLDYYAVEGAGRTDVLTSRMHARDVGRYVGRFTALAEARPYSLFYWHSRAAKLPGSEYATKDGLASYAVLYTLTLAVVILLACVGLEIGVGGVLLASPHSRDLWMGAQVLMVPLVIAAFVSQSYLSIPLMILGTFKFGFPEVTSALYRAFAPQHARKPRLQRLLMLANGVAFLVHHFAGILFYCCLLSHLARATEVVALVPLAAQHAISFLKYVRADVCRARADGRAVERAASLKDIGAVFGSIGAGIGDEDREPRRGLLKRTLGRVRERSSSARTLYTGATLAIEFWFQFEVYAFLPAVSLLPRVALFLLLSSHYVWFVVGVAGLFVNVGPKPKPNARPAGHWGFPSDFMSRRWASRKRVADNAAASDDLKAGDAIGLARARS